MSPELCTVHFSAWLPLLGCCFGDGSGLVSRVSSVPLFCWVIFHYMNTLHLDFSLGIDRHLISAPCLMSRRKGAMEFLYKALYWLILFSLLLGKHLEKVAKSLDSCTLNVLKIIRIFLSGFHVLYSHQVSLKVSMALHPVHHLMLLSSMAIKVCIPQTTMISIYVFISSASFHSKSNIYYHQNCFKE